MQNDMNNNQILDSKSNDKIGSSKEKVNSVVLEANNVGDKSFSKVTEANKNYADDMNVFLENEKDPNLTKKIIFICVYFAVVIGTEFSYRNPLFEESITIEEDIQSGYDKDDFFFEYWKLISELGTAKVTLTIFVCVFFFCPLNFSTVILQVISYASYTTNVLKMIYKSHRPYWHSDKIIPPCNSGYGNPSGHSMTSVSFYLTLSHLLTNYQYFEVSKYGNVVKVIVFVVLMCIAFLVMFSRIVLGAHSINQVIYGGLMGLGIYFIEIHILSYHKYTPKRFINFFKGKINLIVYFSLHLCMLLISLIVFLTWSDETTDEIKKSIFNGIKCKIKKDYLMFQNDGFYQSLSLCGLIGMHLGILLLFFLLERKGFSLNSNIISWNYSSVLNYFKRLPIILISGVGILFYFLIPGKWSLALIFIFKSMVGFFTATLGITGIGIYVCIILNFANEKISFYKSNIESLSQLQNPS